MINARLVISPSHIWLMLSSHVHLGILQNQNQLSKQQNSDLCDQFRNQGERIYYVTALGVKLGKP